MGNYGISIKIDAPSSDSQPDGWTFLGYDSDGMAQYAETQRPSYSQPNSCPTCGMSWPFSGACENCRRDSYREENKRTRRSKGAQKAAASRKRNKANKQYNDLMDRYQAGDATVNATRVERARIMTVAAEEAYWKKMRDIEFKDCKQSDGGVSPLRRGVMRRPGRKPRAIYTPHGEQAMFEEQAQDREEVDQWGPEFEQEMDERFERDETLAELETVRAAVLAWA